MAHYPPQAPPQMMMPQAQPNNVVFVNQQPIVNSNIWAFENEWHNDLCGCCEDCGQCCFAFFCGACFMCSLLSAMRENCCVYMCVPNPLLAMRTKVRSTFRIKGSIMKDFCTTICCPFCSGLQIANELRYRGLM